MANYLSTEDKLFLMGTAEVDTIIKGLREVKKKIDEIEIELFKLKAEKIEEEEVEEEEAKELSELANETLKRGRLWSDVRDEL